MNELPLCAYCARHPVKRRGQKFCSRKCWQKDHAHKPKKSTCEVCHKSFTQPRTHDRKTCSKKCAGVSTGRTKSTKIDYTCQQCNKVFTDQKGRKRKFCSRTCSDKGRKQTPTRYESVPCPTCGNNFNRPLNRNHQVNQFCSKKCYYVSIQAKPIHKKCKNCNKSFTVQKMEKNRKFCCHDCYTTWNTGDNHVLHVKSHEDYYGPNWQQQRRKARERDGYKCRACGHTEKHIGRELDVHHIKAFRSYSGDWAKANRLKNLICLCPRCHKLAEHSKIPIQPNLI